MTRSENNIFEDEVRRIARALWPSASGGAVIINGRERDGVFDDGELVHIIEATVSRKLEKIKEDLRKSTDLVKDFRRIYPEKLLKIWLITSDEPTADQRGAVPEFRKKAKCPIEICSFMQFSSKLVDSAAYLSFRQKYPFGSVRNPADDRDTNVPLGEYVQLDMFNRLSKEPITLEDIVSEIILDKNTSNVCLLGDYGSGKSMTLREIFYELRTLHLKSKTRRFPIYLNLRDHFGQNDPAEALMRHGRSIGMANPGQLVAAWRAGYTFLILDGFDEMSSIRLVRGASKIKMARRQAVGLVQSFVDQSPNECRIIVSGREHYFDSQDELKSAIGLRSGDILLSVSEFSHDQIARYLSKKGVNQHIPEWLPSRPLLLGYLVVRGLFERNSRLENPIMQEDGWDYILDRVCEREARQIDPVLIEPELVRRFIERLASKARNTTSRRGPIYMQDISAVFEEVFDRPPDEKAETLMLRLPGLTASSGGETSREFIDDDFVDACRAGDVARYAQSPFAENWSDLESANAQTGGLGCRLAALKLGKAKVTEKQFGAALAAASKKAASPALLIDLVKVSQELSYGYSEEGIYIKDGFFNFFEVFEAPNFSKITFQECYFDRVDIDLDATRSTSPKFVRCHIEEMSGPLSQNDIPVGIVDNKTEIVTFTQEAQTNADILNLEIPLSVRVLLTVLRKLFMQAGRGRRENAFYRGLDTNARAYVSDILSILESLGFAHPHKINGPTVWIQNRARASEAREIINAPQISQHIVLTKVRAL